MAKRGGSGEEWLQAGLQGEKLKERVRREVLGEGVIPYSPGQGVPGSGQTVLSLIPVSCLFLGG